MGNSVIILVIVAGLFVPSLISSQYYMGIAADGVVLGILAISIGFLAHRSGLISLGHTAFYGGIVYKLPLTAENDFLPDLEGIPADVRAKAKILVLCYPNSPTGRTAPPEFFERAARYRRRRLATGCRDPPTSLPRHHQTHGHRADRVRSCRSPGRVICCAVGISRTASVNGRTG